MVLDGPHPGATINIQVGSSLTKGGGGQTKNSGKLIYQAVYYSLNTQSCSDWSPSLKCHENIRQMRNRLGPRAHQVGVDKKLVRVSLTSSGVSSTFSSFAVWTAAFRQHRNSRNCVLVFTDSSNIPKATPQEWPSHLRICCLIKSGTPVCQRYFQHFIKE